MNEIVDPYALAAFIKNSEKKTPMKAYVNGDFEGVSFEGLKVFGEGRSRVIFGDYKILSTWLSANEAVIEACEVENDRRHSALPLLDYTHVNARIEPGAMIRSGAIIRDNAVVMMGAVINIGADIGEGAMIDMNAVVGARGVVGKRSHIGAGAVIAGVLEPPSKTPVIVEDDCLIGANAVVLEGVRIGKGAVVAAGAIVTKDVPENAVVAGSPAQIIKMKDDQTRDKTQILDDLRKLGD